MKKKLLTFGLEGVAIKTKTNIIAKITNLHLLLNVEDQQFRDTLEPFHIIHHYYQ